MLNHIVRFMKEEDGATAPEYGLMVALIASVIIGGVTLIGANLNQLFNDVGALLTLGS